MLDLLVVDSGFTAPSLALAMQREGRRWLSVCQAGALGDTWPNPGCTPLFPPQAEIEAYMNRIADEGGLGPCMEFDARPAVQAAYNAELHRKLARTVWNTSGCRSRFLEAEGSNRVLWPVFTFRLRQRLARFDWRVFHAVEAGA